MSEKNIKAVSFEPDLPQVRGKRGVSVRVNENMFWAEWEISEPTETNKNDLQLEQMIKLDQICEKRQDSYINEIKAKFPDEDVKVEPESHSNSNGDSNGWTKCKNPNIEYKPAHDDENLANILLGGNHSSKNSKNASDGYRYWISEDKKMMFRTLIKK